MKGYIKYFKGITTMLLLCLVVSSCDDFLDRPPLGESEQANFFQTSDDAVLATNGIYNSLRRWFITGGFPILDIMSDEAGKGSSPTDASFLLDYENFNMTPNQGQLTQMWNNLYLGVRRANSVVEFVPPIDMDQTLKDRLLGEARFLRAYFYFELVRAYGDVPKILTTAPEQIVRRSPASEIYNEVIIPDLEFALSVLPRKSEYPDADLGRATQGAAQGMLAKVYLFLNNTVRAEELAIDVIESGEYFLDPNFDNVHEHTNIQGSGSIFEISSISAGFNDGGNQFANTYGVRGQGKGWGFIRPTLDYIRSYDPEDPRMDASVIFIGETIDGELITGDGGTPDSIFNAQNELVEIETYVQKTWVPGNIPNVTFGANRIILRLADILLIAAEASNANGKTAQALGYLNEVRERARGGNPGILPDITETNQAALQRIILDERKFELAFEQHRFLDLVRTGLASEILGPLGFQAGTHEVLPIPQAEIDITEGAITQNPNY